MANGLLEANVIGNLTKEPEVKAWQGQQYAVFSVAVNTFTRGKGEETVYVDCSLWGKQVDYFMKAAHKGSEVFLSGSLRIREFEYNGEKRSKITVNVGNFRVLSGPRASSSGNGSGYTQRQEKATAFVSQQAVNNNTPVEDIPF